MEGSYGSYHLFYRGRTTQFVGAMFIEHMVGSKVVHRYRSVGSVKKSITQQDIEAGCKTLSIRETRYTQSGKNEKITSH